MDVNPERKRDWGRRLEVFWEDDDTYYPGVVTGYSVTSGKHTVLYEDGGVERVNLDEVGLLVLFPAGGGGDGEVLGGGGSGEWCQVEVVDHALITGLHRL
jgi:hypothetical protein